MRSMLTLAQYSTGRMLLHLIAMAGDHSFRFHFAGIGREFSSLVRWG
jgi:hypothetical protein